MRYGIATLLFIFLIILGAVALFGRGGGGNTGPTTKFTKLAEYDDNRAASVSWTQQGKLVGDDQRKAVRVTVTKDTRRVEILDGYEERVEKSTEFSNSDAAFAAFTRSLDNLGFGRERQIVVADERGVCPTGNRFIYRVTDGAKEIMRTWSTTCKNTDGPFGGSSAQTIARLFKDQITDYRDFVKGIKL